MTVLLQLTALFYLRILWGLISFKSFEINFLHRFNLNFASAIFRRTPRITTYLVSGLDVPFRILKELVDILAKHLLKVTVVDASALCL